MSETQYVKVLRVTRKYFAPMRTRFFYLPMQVTISGYHGAVFEHDDMPTVWGFETVEAAWAAIDNYNRLAEQCEED